MTGTLTTTATGDGATVVATTEVARDDDGTINGHRQPMTTMATPAAHRRDNRHGGGDSHLDTATLTATTALRRPERRPLRTGHTGDRCARDAPLQPLRHAPP